MLNIVNKMYVCISSGRVVGIEQSSGRTVTNQTAEVDPNRKNTHVRANLEVDEYLLNREDNSRRLCCCKSYYFVYHCILVHLCQFVLSFKK